METCYPWCTNTFNPKCSKCRNERKDQMNIYYEKLYGKSKWYTKNEDAKKKITLVHLKRLKELEDSLK